ncbi:MULTISPECIES: plasmid mobilization protein [Symbiopectobacterium]|uniref:plasmid mobilization protein n=1 Tax=Symbiopectobacterium TaxID=801 RepID=UPI001A33DA3A|nr:MULTISPECIES: plasmid mobilization relaxosome protein MobC [Symbiopectobacterium]MBG6247074.1 plasmid mobilization relaxosome protein MobC [Candidatus Symbiopectobacterium sp. PLON1]MBT9430847.1 plasmid mobilization relaxosome protein MobC [Candidatus Symbiopectobacterium endolongispinus]
MDTGRKRDRIELNPEERRDISIQFRVNKAEFEYLKSLIESSGLERGYYIKKEILKSEPVVKIKMPEFEQSLYREIQHQGNNINQIAKKLNTNEDFKQSVASETNFAIKQLMKRILKACEVYAV